MDKEVKARSVVVLAILVVCGALALLLSSCATTPMSQNDPLAQYTQWVQGAQWVGAIADGVVLTGCVSGKFKPLMCAAYNTARTQLDADLIVVQNLIAKQATPADVQAAVAQAMIAYLKIEAAYRGQYEVL